MPEKTFETINVTDPAQVVTDPIIEPVDDKTDDLNESGAEAPGADDEGAAEDITILAPETDPQPDAPEDKPAEDEIKERLDKYSAAVDALTDRIDGISAALDRLIELEEKRAAGPQGFFKPLEGGEQKSQQNNVLPRIERIYK